MNRKIIPIILATTLGIAFQAAHADTIKPLNRIVMEVNSSVITYRDIERTVRELKSTQGKTSPKSNLFRLPSNACWNAP